MATVLVTGVSSGIGRALARRFASEGWRVLATVRNVGAGVDFDLPSEDRARIEVLPLDLVDGRSIEALGDEIRARGIEIDLLVNNAGFSTVGALEVLADASLRLSLETNVFGPLALTRRLLPQMRSRGSGRIVFIGAIGALLNTPYLGAYCTAKHALDCVAATLDLELQPFGIRVVSVHPGATTTEIGKKMLLEGGTGTVYEVPTARYAEGLRGRIAGSPDTGETVALEVFRICTLPDPEQRYVITSSPVGAVLEPLVNELERLHAREREAALVLQRGGSEPGAGPSPSPSDGPAGGPPSGGASAAPS
jgi:NAD(P)-dependent dehydrogenase (short-subunit alcohol dehydrogenase family)